jgi:hypothetical protein
MFESMEDAKEKLHTEMYTQAEQDCEGDNNCGNALYKREFTVGGVVYIAELYLSYYLLDETFYCISDSTFNTELKA